MMGSMTEIDTAEPAVDRRAGQHPAMGREPRLATDDAQPAGGSSVAAPAVHDGAVVIHLNDAATIYDTLASEIAGTAIGWSADALAQLERGLLQRYGALIGGRHPVRRLVRLASRPSSR